MALHPLVPDVARFRIAVAFGGALALGVGTLAATALARHGGAQRSIGWLDAQRGDAWVVDSVDPAGPAADRLLEGDRLISLDGDTLIGRYGAYYFRRTAPIGKRYSIRVERNDREVEETLTVSAGERRLGSRLVYFTIALVWCVVGLFIGWARPDDGVARIAFVAGLSTGIVYFQVGVFPGVIPGSLYQPLHIVLGYHFFYAFPAGVRRGRLSLGLLWLLYAWCVAAILISQPLNWTFLTQGAGATAAWAAAHATRLRLKPIIGDALMFPLVIGSVMLIASAYRRVGDRETRRRIRWVVYSSVAGLSPLLVWATFALIRATATQDLSPTFVQVHGVVNLVTNAGTVLIPLGVAYAVVRHRVFDIAVVVRRGLRYLLARRALQVLLALPLLALLSTAVVHRDQTLQQILTENLAYLWLIAAGGLSLRFRRPLGRWLDRRFFREQYDREQVLVGLMDDLRRLAAPADVSSLLRAQLDHALHPTITRVWFRGDPDPPPEHLLSRIAREGVGPDAPITDVSHLPAGIRLAVPMAGSDERPVGVLMLGEKRSDEPYSGEDLSLLGAVARQAAMVRDYLILRERINEERLIRTDVLAHLEPDRVNLVKECPKCGSCHDSDAERCDRDGHELGLSLPVSRTVAGHYRLDQLIGRGGMGAVYEAFDLRLERCVAIKFLLGRGLDHEHASRRFRREATAIARIQHPNIVSVYDYGTVEPHGAYLVMERIRGVTLREELAGMGPLSGRAAAEWFGPSLEGIAAAHEEGVIHRDLKPDNVVRVRPEYGPPVVKILDFGIAKLRPIDTSSDQLTTSGMVLGTPGYMSPEQLLGNEVDARTDIFAVGVMVVEALTGKRPFQGGTYRELLASIILEPYHLPGTGPAMRALDAVLQRCLAKEPRDRFASAAELRCELVPALRACPSPPPPPSS
ncbi:MAG: protein kinase [Gemmatimonadota bacterium]